MTKIKSAKTASAHHVGLFRGAELAALAPLIRNTNFNDDVLAECTDRGFIPLVLSNCLTAARFLARTVLAAQSAQRTCGVPASVLISIAFYRAASEVESLLDEPDCAVEWPGCDCCYSPKIQKWFMEMAAHLTRGRKSRRAARLLPKDNAAPSLPTLQAYVTALSAAGFWDELEGRDILSNIEHFGLDECDLGGSRQPNEYRRSYYRMSIDEHGAKQLRLAWLDLLPAPVQKRALRTPQQKALARSTVKNLIAAKLVAASDLRPLLAR